MNKKTDSSKKPERKLNSLGRYSGLAFEMLGIMGILVFAGFKLDDWLNLNHVFTVILAILSVFAALLYVIFKIK